MIGREIAGNYRKYGLVVEEGLCSNCLNETSI